MYFFFFEFCAWLVSLLIEEMSGLMGVCVVVLVYVL